MRYVTHALGSEPSQWVVDAGAFVSGVFTGPTGLLAPVTGIVGAATGTTALTHFGAALHGSQTAASYGQLQQLSQQPPPPKPPDWLTAFDGPSRRGGLWWWLAGGLVLAAAAGTVVLTSQ